MDTYTMYPIGIIHKDKNRVFIEVFETFRDGLFGLEQFSHIIVFSWFHKNDTTEKRQTLKVHSHRGVCHALPCQAQSDRHLHVQDPVY